MKRTILLTTVALTFISFANAQKQKPVTMYAITGTEKGSVNWSEVRLIDINSGKEIQTIYQTNQEISLLNARTGKEIVKQDNIAQNERAIATYTMENVNGKKTLQPFTGDIKTLPQNQRVTVRYSREATDRPFSTLSAACAYDEKHDRLYYTPMGLNELRYIDLKSKSPSIKYFEGEAFGAVKSRADIPNHVTRMVIASDGKGYALTNNAEHLVQFTTNRKAAMTDLGSITDDAANGVNSIHSANSYGGDMIADDNKNVYVITAYRKVFKISLETKVATYLGNIQGLPAGYTTNGAAVESDNSVIVTSSQSTGGYFRVNMKTLQAELIPNEGKVFNASDLANGNLLRDKKADNDIKQEPIVNTSILKRELEDMVQQNNIAVFPNPVSLGGTIKLTFTDQKEGIYSIQLMDMGGKLINSKQVNITGVKQVESYELPELSAKGNYLIKVVSGKDKLVSISKIIVQ